MAKRPNEPQPNWTKSKETQLCERVCQIVLACTSHGNRLKKRFSLFFLLLTFSQRCKQNAGRIMKQHEMSPLWMSDDADQSVKNYLYEIRRYLHRYSKVQRATRCMPHGVPNRAAWNVEKRHEMGFRQISVPALTTNSSTCECVFVCVCVCMCALWDISHFALPVQCYSSHTQLPEWPNLIYLASSCRLQRNTLQTNWFDS